MNRLRPFLLRGTPGSRCVLFLIFIVIFARALLSSVVMLDPHAPPGSFGMVMCSGHGPMFDDMSHQMNIDSNMSMHMPMNMDMSMGDMAMPGMHHAGTTEHMHDGDSSDSNNLCSFSAVFALGTATALFLLLFVALICHARMMLPRYRAPFFAFSLRLRPLGQAPPTFPCMQ